MPQRIGNMGCIGIIFMIGLFAYSLVTVPSVSVGDTGVTKQSITLVMNYNAPSPIKPECEVPTGAKVEVIDTSTLSQGGGTPPEPLVQLKSSSCTGWFVRDAAEDFVDFDR